MSKSHAKMMNKWGKWPKMKKVGLRQNKKKKEEKKDLVSFYIYFHEYFLSTHANC